MTSWRTTQLNEMKSLLRNTSEPSARKAIEDAIDAHIKEHGVEIDKALLPASLQLVLESDNVIYSSFNKPLKNEQLPKGYQFNVFDRLHNAIAALDFMMKEVGRVGYIVMGAETREACIDYLAEEFAEMNGGFGDVKDIAKNGMKGFNDMSDIELLYEVQNDIAGNVGFAENDKLPEKLQWVLQDVVEFTAKEVSVIAENSLLTECDKFEKFLDTEAGLE